MKKILLITSIFIFSILTSCTKDFEDLNKNPNGTDNMEPDYLFTHAMLSGVSNYNTDVYLHQWGIMNWTMYIATRGGVESGKEYEMPGGIDNFWTEQYADNLGNLQEAMSYWKDNEYFTYKYNIARIWKVYTYQKMTDLWGAIPYSQALMGFETGNFQPAYDSQQDIYNSLIDELNAAVTTLSETLESDTLALANPQFSKFENGADPIYDGDVMKWIKFGNSLLFRMAMRISEVEPAKAQSIVQELQNKPLIADKTESATFPYNTVTKKNPFAEVIYTGQDAGRNYPSKFFVDLLKEKNDPRVKVFFTPTPNSVAAGNPNYNGIPNLLAPTSPEWANYPEGEISEVGEYFTQLDTKGMLLSFSEVLFLKSEAALNGWFEGSADVYYRQAVKANIEYFASPNISLNEIYNYITNIPAVDKENIITQKWISLAFQDGYEAFAEYRRTGFPVLKNFENQPINVQNFPNRITYPATEISYNFNSYQNAVNTQGADIPATKIWWDVN